VKVTKEAQEIRAAQKTQETRGVQEMREAQEMREVQEGKGAQEAAEAELVAVEEDAIVGPPRARLMDLVTMPREGTKSSILSSMALA
jgi:hypothetical protein